MAQRSILAFFARSPAAQPKRPPNDADDFEQPAHKRAVVIDDDEKKKAVPVPAAAGTASKVAKKAKGANEGDDDAFAETASAKATQAGAAAGVEPAAEAKAKKGKKAKRDEESSRSAAGGDETKKKASPKKAEAEAAAKKETPKKKKAASKATEGGDQGEGDGEAKSAAKTKKEEEGVPSKDGKDTPKKKTKSKAAGEGGAAEGEDEKSAGKKKKKEKSDGTPSKGKKGGEDEGDEGSAKKGKSDTPKKASKAAEGEGEGDEGSAKKGKKKKSSDKQAAAKADSPAKPAAPSAALPAASPQRPATPPRPAAASPDLASPSPAKSTPPPPAATSAKAAAVARAPSMDDIEEVGAGGGGGADTESDEDLKRYRPLPAKPAPPAAAAAAASAAPVSGAGASGQISVGAKKAFFRGGQFGGHSVAPPNRGKKAMPQGEEHCLFGLTFAFTGVLDSLEREEAGALVEAYGGKVMKSAGKTLQYLVAGLEAGESKLRKAAEAGTKVIDEDGLFELIRTRKGVRLSKAQLAKLPKRADPTDVAPAVAAPAAAATSPQRQLPSPTKVHASSPSPLLSPGARLASAPSAPVAAAAAGAGVETQLWVDKYAPQRTDDIVGNAAAVNRLEAWLRAWKAGGSGKRAALLTGPPGIGKSSSAHLIAHKLKYHPLETNASDARSRAALLALASATTSTSLHKFFGTREEADAGAAPEERRVVLIMDEVDGMSGTADRGGMKELIGVIGRTGVPIICIGNDARHPKIRSLATHCEEIKYKRPGLPDVERRAIAVAKAEGIPDAEFPRVRSLVAQANGDMRQALNLLQTAYPPRRAGRAQRYSESTGRKEVTETNVFELVPAMFRYPEGASMDERIDAYFIDDLIVPLMVWECYPSAPRANSPSLRELAAAADAASESDLVSRVVRRDQAYTLTPALAVMGTVRPCFEVRGGGVAPRFPALLGKMSATNKRYRLLKELQAHMSRQVSANKLEVGLDYLRLLHDAVTRPLVAHGEAGVGAVLEVMGEYGLTREDWNTVGELVEWPGATPPAVPTQAKTQLTLQYKKRADLKHGMSRARATKAPNVLFDVDADADDADDAGGGGGEDEGGDEDEGAEFTNDKFVKRVVPKAKKAAAKKGRKSE